MNVKEVQKMEVSPRLVWILAVGAVLFTAGVVVGTLSARSKTARENEQGIQSQPTAPIGTPQPAAHECVAEPWNPLRALCDRVEQGMTRERLERNVKELDDGRLPPVTIHKERVTLANGASYGIEYWSWQLEMKKAENEMWIIMLTLDLCENKVVGVHYTPNYKVSGVAIHK